MPGPVESQYDSQGTLLCHDTQLLDLYNHGESSTAGPTRQQLTLYECIYLGVDSTGRAIVAELLPQSQNSGPDPSQVRVLRTPWGALGEEEEGCLGSTRAVSEPFEILQEFEQFTIRGSFQNYTTGLDYSNPQVLRACITNAMADLLRNARFEVD
ncbi:hypothetical protein C1H76_2030 [Elsinoe australis]|uniref:Uncharacterized protein n=1 Tax=Elsinoe australis TaxID=40998 RepID=A0A4U7B7H6_9PEZI|nr:hypothetical protein C1H76_2030 [Elsinoe australis]